MASPNLSSRLAAKRAVRWDAGISIWASPCVWRILPDERVMERSQKVLAAFPSRAIPTLERVLGGHVGLVPVHSLPHAKALLQSNADSISLVACGVHFDESRMFDLLRYVRESFPRIPVVCCRVLEIGWLSRLSIEPIALSAASLGAVTFFDLPGRAKEVGREAAEQEFQSVLLKHLPRPPAERP
jgi:hypothetical protein